MLTGDFFKKIIIMRDAPALYYNDDGVLIMSVYDFLLNEGKGDQTWDKSFMYPSFYILHQQYEKNK